MQTIAAGRPAARHHIAISRWAVTAFAVAAFVLLPVATIALIAVADTGTLWGHVLVLCAAAIGLEHAGAAHGHRHRRRGGGDRGGLAGFGL